MILSEAIKRLSFTIAKQNKPNKNDAEALNEIIEFINLSNKKVIQENLLLAKMFCFVLKEFLNHYKNVNFASKKINADILSLPIEYHLQSLKSMLDMHELTQIYKDGIPSEEVLKESIETWPIDHVIQNFEFNFNLILNHYKNV
jgi:hypothetical protein